mgnify:CR=1 FL=1
MVMIMKQTIELNNEDIRRLIAKEFHVEEEKVSVSLRPVYRGYGIYEHKEYEVFATINK